MELRSRTACAIVGFMARPTAVFFVLSALLLSPGCSTNSPEEMDRLAKEDPAFRQMIIARDQVHAQIHAIKEDLLAKKRVLDSQVEKLRAEYDAYAKTQNAKIEKYLSVIEVDRNLLKRQLGASVAHLESKQTELQGYQKTLADVKKVLRESKGISLSGQEKQKWEERILMLSEKIRPLTDEIQELKLQIRLRKQKIGFLK